MTKKLAIAASVAVLVAISGQAFARNASPNARYWPETTGLSEQQAARAYDAYNAYNAYNAFIDPAMAMPLYWPNAHRYEGGPKTDY
jgi:hypothetical protein